MTCYIIEYVCLDGTKEYLRSYNTADWTYHPIEAIKFPTVGSAQVQINDGGLANCEIVELHYQLGDYIKISERRKINYLLDN